MSSIVFDIQELYQRTFGSRPYVVKNNTLPQQQQQPYQLQGSHALELFDKVGNTLQENVLGVEIWLPTILANLPTALFPDTFLKLPYSVIRITGSSTIVRTPLAQRRGTVKELYAIDDYKIVLKGFFIDENRRWPYDGLHALKKLHEMGEAFSLDNALSNVFFNVNDKVVMTGFDLPEVEGGRKHVRPFIIQLESDSVFDLSYNV